ncbi:MAG: protoporphyrinogen oxidase [Thermoleophilia bacterium]|nr:protoporphyrinogen oxidase [Thermoleophilia bacterium]
MTEGRRARIVVVGGGMTGLGAARSLEDARAADPSVDWVLYEAEPRLGGKVHTVRRDGFVVEGGPDSAIIEKPWPIQMARRLGIGDRLLDSNEDVRRSFVYARGRLHELPEGIILMVPTRIVPFALSGLISWPGKFRMGLDLVLPRGGEDEDESLACFVRRRLGEEALARIAEPIVAGIHAGDPETMSVAATFPMFRQMEHEYRSLIVGMLARRKARERARASGASRTTVPRRSADGVPGRASTAAGGSSPRPSAGGTKPGGPSTTGPRSYFYSFATGLGDLSDSVIASLPPERLRAGVAVETMACSGAGCGQQAGSGRYALTLGDGTREVADAVVLAGPAFASGTLLRNVAPLAARDLESIEYVTTATASLAFRREQVAHPLRGFGYVVPRAEGRSVMATTWSSSKFPGRAPEGHVLLRSFLGRAGLEAAAQLDDAEMATLVRRELRDVLGIAAEPEFIEIFRWPRGMPQYRVGHKALVDGIEGELAAVPGVELAGGAYHGIGIGDCLREGAAAAERALEHVRGLPEDAPPPAPPDVPAADGVED